MTVVLSLLFFLAFALAIPSAKAMTPTGSNNVKRILVTGGNKGIGKAVCEKLVRDWNDTFVFLGSRDLERGNAAVQSILQALGDNCRDRLQVLVIDTSSDSSVKEAAIQMEGELYGIVNNAGIGFGISMDETINTNYFGPRRINEAFGKFLKRPGGRIVNVASASGPNYVSRLPDSHPHKSLLAHPWTIVHGISQVDEMARSMESSDAYGASKALLNAYTYLHAKLEKDLIINSVTPGFIATDLTAGYGATNPTSKGAEPICYLMMDDETIPKQPTGRYYGSDSIRSPISFYRGPGEPPYENNDDLVELPETAAKMAMIL